MFSIIRYIENILFRICSNRFRISLARKWGVIIGNNCVINSPCNFGSEPYLISIGNNCLITAGVSFITHDGGVWIFKKKNNFKNETLFGPIVIHDNCMIGLKSIILLNVKIGPNSIVGAGSVVTQDIPPNTVYAGNPAKFICTYDEYLEKCKLKSTGDLPRKRRKKLLLQIFKDMLNN